MATASSAASSRPDSTLPYAPEAELHVLGGLIWGDAVATAKVLGELVADDFHVERHRLAFVAAGLLHQRGEPVEATSLGEQMRATGDLERAGGVAFLAEVMDSMPSVGLLDHHIRIVRDRSLRRRLYRAAQQIISDVTDSDGRPADEIVSAAEQRVFGVSSRMATGAIESAKEIMWQVLDLAQHGGVPSVPTGMAGFDERFGVLKPGNLVIVAGATSMGKSAWALQAAHNAAVYANTPTAIFSIEMTKTENVARMLANDGLLDLDRMLNGKLGPEDFPRLEQSATKISTAPLYLDDSAVRAGEIRARARRLKAEKGLGLVVVDHIHDMEEAGDSRREQLGTIARSLKLMAKELDVPVIAVSQMSRAPTQRSDHRPQLSDLRETGDLEAVASAVIFLYRPEYYYGPEKDGKDIRGVAEAIVAKNRNGPTGSVELRFEAPSARFDGAPRDWRVKP